MDILITGSTGYLGRELLRKINKNKYNKVICLIHTFKKYIENDFLYKNCIIYKGDINDHNLIYTIFKENNVNYIIHCAANKYIDMCEKYHLDAINTI